MGHFAPRGRLLNNVDQHVRRSIMTNARSATDPHQRRILLLTFDAFSTLFHPRRPVHELYASVAHSFGLPASVVTPARLQTAFKEAFKAQCQAHPNYGREEVLQGRYGGPRQWWGDVIQASFAKLLKESEGGKAKLPDGLVEKLVDVFASREGYTLYDDVEPLFETLKGFKGGNTFDRVITGVISNSDDRVPAVLKSLGLTVGNVRADEGWSSLELPGFEKRSTMDAQQERIEDNDVDMVITSYEAGDEKPHKSIFDVAARQGQRFEANLDNGFTEAETDHASWVRIHVGDDLEKDYKGAIRAGWQSLMVNRDNEKRSTDVKVINSLRDLIPEIEKCTAKGTR
jgi:putative hydrolase of the HAD superfamily